MMDRKTRLMLDALHLCGFRPGSWEKRFVKDMYPLGPYDLLSPRQLQAVDSLYWHYRRQINALWSNHRDFPIPTQPTYDALAYEAFTTREKEKKEVEVFDKKAAAAMQKLKQWNQKVKGE